MKCKILKYTGMAIAMRIMAIFLNKLMLIALTFLTYRNNLTDCLEYIKI